MNPKPSRSKRLPTPHSRDLPLVIVEWEDAALGSADDTPANIVPSAVINFTAGFLLRANRKHVELVIDATPDDNTVRWPYTIPAKLVRAIHRTAFTPASPPVDPPPPQHPLAS